MPANDNTCSIERDGNPISPSMLNVLPGENIHLRLAGANLVSEILWSIAGENHKSYQTSASTGILTDLTKDELTGETVSFFWGDTGSKTVSVSYKVQNATCATSITFNVASPVWSLSAIERTVEFTSNKLAYGLIKPADNDYWGIRFSANVNVPPGFANGRYALFALLKQVIYRKYKSGQCKTKSTGAGYCFDDINAFPTGGDWTTGTACTWDDQPHSMLQEQYLTDETRHDQFTTYLMFRPNGGHYVALAKMNWWWKACVQLQNGTWVFLNRSQGIDPHATAITTAPTWLCTMSPTEPFTDIACPHPFPL
jgi:hypothetical protein